MAHLETSSQIIFSKQFTSKSFPYQSVIISILIIKEQKLSCQHRYSIHLQIKRTVTASSSRHYRSFTKSVKLLALLEFLKVQTHIQAPLAIPVQSTITSIAGHSKINMQIASKYRERKANDERKHNTAVQETHGGMTSFCRSKAGLNFSAANLLLFQELKHRQNC